MKDEEEEAEKEDVDRGRGRRKEVRKWRRNALTHQLSQGTRQAGDRIHHPHPPPPTPCTHCLDLSSPSHGPTYPGSERTEHQTFHT